MERLTKHQNETLEEVAKASRSGRAARSELIGSRGACQHLERKGYITSSEVYGPRGGTTYAYQLTAEGLELLSKRGEGWAQLVAQVIEARAYEGRLEAIERALEERKTARNLAALEVDSSQLEEARHAQLAGELEAQRLRQEALGATSPALRSHEERLRDWALELLEEQRLLALEVGPGQALEERLEAQLAQLSPVELRARAVYLLELGEGLRELEVELGADAGEALGLCELELGLVQRRLSLGDAVELLEELLGSLRAPAVRAFLRLSPRAALEQLEGELTQRCERNNARIADCSRAIGSAQRNGELEGEAIERRRRATFTAELEGLEALLVTVQSELSERPALEVELLEGEGDLPSSSASSHAVSAWRYELEQLRGLREALRFAGGAEHLEGEEYLRAQLEEQTARLSWSRLTAREAQLRELLAPPVELEGLPLDAAIRELDLIREELEARGVDSQRLLVERLEGELVTVQVWTAEAVDLLERARGRRRELEGEPIGGRQLAASAAVGEALEELEGLRARGRRLERELSTARAELEGEER